jgi:formamidopyrimidine-DNA glycosylase
MPEGGEVRHIVDQLNSFTSSNIITGIDLLSGRYLKSQPDGISEFINNLPLQIKQVNCKGKFIYFELSNGWSIWNTLGLTGGWTNLPDKEFNRVRISFAEGRPVYFHDMRNFGTIKFEKNNDKLQQKLKSLGPDILQEDVPDFVLKAKFKKNSKKTLPELLMDQKIISGVGNYIKAEALYLSKLSPHRLAGSLTDDEIALLNKAMTRVIRESYNSGGSTFKNYSDFDGNIGEYTDRFMVYNKKQDPHGNPVLKEETKDKRVTHWVPLVQK